MSIFYVGNTYAGMSSSYIGGQSANSFGFNVGFTRMNDVLPTTYISERTSNPGHATRVDNE